MDSSVLQDEAFILHVKNWQTADKYVVCFTKEHGKLRFIAYGARYPKNVAGRLLQPFAWLNVDVQQGQKLDKLRSCELCTLPKAMNIEQMAYGAVVAELTALFTEDKAPQPELYQLLVDTFKIILERNPRIVILSFAIKLLDLTGFAPQLEQCVSCGREIEDHEDCWFSPLQGGSICTECRQSLSGDGLEHCAASTREFWRTLAALDFVQPQHFTVQGSSLMELEKILLRYIYFQTDKPLKSMDFIRQLNMK